MVEKEETISEDEVEVKILEQLKMNGLVNSDLESIRHLDREIQQKSQVIPVSMKNGTIQEHYSSVASENRFQVLRHFVRDRLKQSGQEILAGRTEIAPYKMGNRQRPAITAPTMQSADLTRRPGAMDTVNLNP